MNTLQSIINFATQVLNTFLQLATTFNTPLRIVANNPETSIGQLEKYIIWIADTAGQTWIGDMTIFTMLFSTATLTTIITVGLVRWILDILP